MNETLGPNFEKLTEKQKRFALALMDDDDHASCARKAGYECKNPEGFKKVAWQQFTNPKVQAALHELAVTRLVSSKVSLASHLVHLATGAKREGDQLKAMEMIMNRVGMHAVSESHVITQDVSVTKEAMEEELRQLVSRHPEYQALLPKPALQIESSFVEIDLAAERAKILAEI